MAGTLSITNAMIIPETPQTGTKKMPLLALFFHFVMENRAESRLFP